MTEPLRHRKQPRACRMSDHALERARERSVPLWAVRAILAAGHRERTRGLECWRYSLPPAERDDPRKADLADIEVVVDHYAGCVVTVHRPSEKPAGRGNDRRANDQNLRIYPPQSGPGDPSRALPSPQGEGPPAVESDGPGVDVARTAATEGEGRGLRVVTDDGQAAPLPQHTTRDDDENAPDVAEFFRWLGRIERRHLVLGWLVGLAAWLLGVFVWLAWIFGRRQP